MAIIGYEKVRGFYIAVHDVARMGEVEGGGGGSNGCQCELNRQHAASHALRQRLSIDELHGDEHHVSGIMELVNRYDVWMGEISCGAGFAAKTFAQHIGRFRD